MKFLIEKEYILNHLKIVEKVCALRGIQPVLSNILFEATEDNKLKLEATDLDIAINTITIANVQEPGSITLPAKKLLEIINKLPNKPISFDLDPNTQIMNISCGKSKFELIGISSDNFPDILDGIKFYKSIKIDIEPFIKGIKYTAFAAASYENRNIISGVLSLIKDNTLEMVATDGNRLTRIIEKLENISEIQTNIESENQEESNEIKVVIPSKTLQEILRIGTLIEDKKIEIHLSRSKIMFKTETMTMVSGLLDGEYPPYKQLIPTSYEKIAYVENQKLIESLEIVSTMVNDKTSIVKFEFGDNQLKLTAETPETGNSEDIIDIDYNYENLSIAFNYKYILESIKTITSERTKISLGGSLSATVFTPESGDDYLCLIMPIQIR